MPLWLAIGVVFGVTAYAASRFGGSVYLSPHFQLHEFVTSTTASKYGIDNTPTAAAVRELRRGARHTLEPLRERWGVPVSVTNGYRSRALHEAMRDARNPDGSRIYFPSETSDHLSGEAADVMPLGLDSDVAWDELVALVEDGGLPELDQAIYYPGDTPGRGHIHLGWGRRARRMVGVNVGGEEVDWS